FGPDGPQPSAGGEWHKEFVYRVGGISHNLPCMPQGPGCIQILERWQIAANHLLRRTDDMLQSAFVIGSGSSVPDGDGGGEDGFDDAGVEVHHHCLWQVELLPEVHPLLSSFGEGADVQLPLEVLGDDGAQKAEGL